MATLLELYQIEVDSKKDPMMDGSPAGEIDTNIEEAVQLRDKIRMALVVHARSLLAGGKLDLGGSPSEKWPVDEDGTNTNVNTAIAWAQRVVASPEAMTDVAMRLALAGGEGFTRAQILDAGDGAIKSAIEPLIPALAKGMHPGR